MTHVQLKFLCWLLSPSLLLSPPPSSLLWLFCCFWNCRFIVTVPRVGLPFFQLFFICYILSFLPCIQLFFLGLMMWFWRRWIACEFLKHLNGWHASKIYGNSMYMVYMANTKGTERKMAKGRLKKWINEWAPTASFIDDALTALNILGIVSPFFSRLFFEVDIHKCPNICFGITFKWHVIWSYTAWMNLHLYVCTKK